MVAIYAHLSILGVGHSLASERQDLLAKLTISLLVLFSHLLVAVLFAVGFWLGAEWGLGSFDETSSMNWMDYFYFSLVNFTTLGRGDLTPMGHLRFITGIEAFHGFLMITASGSFVLQVMAGRAPLSDKG